MSDLDEQVSSSDSERRVLVHNAIVDQVTVIIGQIQLLGRREPPTPLAAMCLDNVIRSAQRIVDLVNQTAID